MIKKEILIIFTSLFIAIISFSLIIIFETTLEKFSILEWIVLLIFLGSLTFSVSYTAYILNVRDWDKEIKKSGWKNLDRKDKLEITLESLLVGIIVLTLAIYAKERFFGERSGFGTYLGTVFLILFITLYVKYRVIPKIEQKTKKQNIRENIR